MYRDVEREPIPLFLRQVGMKKLSGHLFVTAKGFHISLNFMEGKLANGMSTRFDEKLSVILHLMGRISEEQYNFLSGLHQFSDDQVAGILLDQNFAKKKDIYYARIYQLRRIAISTFALQQGQWIFTAGEPDPPLREVFEIPLAGILVEGARAVDHVSPYANRWLASAPVLFNEIPLDCDMYFTDAERAFYADVQRQGRHSCQELIARLNMLPSDFWRGILSFHLMGIVEFEKGRDAPDVSAEIASLLELNRRMMEGVDGPELLGLAASAGGDELERARAEQLARFAPERFGSAAAPEIKAIASAVSLRLKSLASPPLAEADRPTPPPAAWEPPARDEPLAREEPPPGEETPVEDEAAPEWREPAVDLQWHLELEKPDEEPALLSESELIAAPDLAGGEEPPPASLAVEPELEGEPPPRPFQPDAAPASLRMANEDHEKAWDLMLQSKELYEKHEHARAIPLLKKAIRLESNQGDYYYLLGLCQGEAELTRNEAEMNLKKAIELKSWSADPVYALGVLYRRQGKMKLAERCFQRVKEIAYEHTGASRALIALRRMKSGIKGSPLPPKKRR